MCVIYYLSLLHNRSYPRSSSSIKLLYLNEALYMTSQNATVLNTVVLSKSSWRKRKENRCFIITQPRYKYTHHTLHCFGFGPQDKPKAEYNGNSNMSINLYFKVYTVSSMQTSNYNTRLDYHNTKSTPHISITNYACVNKTSSIYHRVQLPIMVLHSHLI